MAVSLENIYFSRVKQIWEPFEEITSSRGKFIIPFCTPISMRPPAMVIGTNHSNFAPGKPESAAKIAKDYATQPATTSTYLTHEHNFARQLRRMCRQADLSLTTGWVGTNRCPVQWESGNNAIYDLRSIAPDEFDACQSKTDDLLCELVHEIQPSNVVLVGHFACRLYYPNLYPHRFSKCTAPPYRQLQPKWSENAGRISWIIPIQHPSMPANEKLATERLREHFRQ